MNNKALDRRVKRHIIAPEHRIFCAVQPGLEEAAEKEIRALGLEPEREKEPGSLIFNARLEDLWKSTLMLRSINRIALRLDEFKAEGFRELKQKLSRIPWELYLREGCAYNLKINVKHCRLHVHDKIAKALQHCLNSRFQELEGLSPLPAADSRDDEALQTLMIRGVDDRFTISLDAGGDSLYERGYRSHVNEAPLRESTAASLLILAGIESGSEIPVLDAMCGSGSFGLEALGISAGLPAAPARSYPFEYWPSFRPGRYDWLRRSLLKTAKTPCPVISSDTDAKSLEAARHNGGLFKEQHGALAAYLAASAPVSEEGTAPAAAVEIAVPEFMEHDFFDGPAAARPAATDPEATDPEAETGTAGLIILNPPYGMRLSLEDRLDFFRRLGRCITEKYKGYRWGIIAPGLDCEKALGLHWEKKYLFRNGGLPVSFLVGNS